MQSVRLFGMDIITLEDAVRSVKVADVFCGPSTRFYAKSTDFVIITKLGLDQGSGIGLAPPV
jgi:hypothetical protein